MYEEDNEIEEAGVKEVINRFKNTLAANKELLEENDWVWDDDIEEKFELESIIVSTIIDNSMALYKLVKDKRPEDAKIAFKWLKELKETYIMFEKRCERFFREGITAIKKSHDGETGKKELSEIIKLKKFENKVNTLYAKGKSQMDTIRLEGSDNDLTKVKLHARTPVVSLAMRNAFEKRHPKIKEHVESRREHYYKTLKDKSLNKKEGVKILPKKGRNNARKT